MNTREEWLTSALALVRAHLLATASAVLPDNVRVSCGFPGGGSARKRIGECWGATNSKDGQFEIFISPVLDNDSVISVLATLVHEAVHATVGLAAGHKAPFKRVAVLAGLQGKMTATEASPALTEILKLWAINLGAYPHGALSMSGRKKQSTRLIKCQCGDCGYVIRTTQKWIDAAGPPLCPCNERAMDGSSDSDEDSGE